MVKNKKKTVSSRKSDSVFSLLFTNASVQTSVFVIFTFISFLAGIKSDMYFIVSFISLCIGSIITGFISGRIKKRNGMLFGAIYSLFFNTLIITLSLIFNAFSIDLTTVFSFTAPVLCSCIGGILAVNIKRNSKIKR